MSRKDIKSRLLLVYSLLVSFVLVIVVIKLIRSDRRFSRRTSAITEAIAKIDYMYSTAVYWYDHIEARDNCEGKCLLHEFPPTTTRTPEHRCCENPGGTCTGTYGAFFGQTWSNLNFGFRAKEKFYNQYEFISNEKGFTARAIGDLDCDGVFSTFEKVGNVVSSNGTKAVLPGGEVRMVHPYE